MYQDILCKKDSCLIISFTKTFNTKPSTLNNIHSLSDAFFILFGMVLRQDGMSYAINDCFPLFTV